MKPKIVVRDWDAGTETLVEVPTVGGIEIELLGTIHNTPKRLQIEETPDGRLEIRSREGHLDIRPMASNSIEVGNVGWGS